MGAHFVSVNLVVKVSVKLHKPVLKGVNLSELAQNYIYFAQNNYLYLPKSAIILPNFFAKPLNLAPFFTIFCPSLCAEKSSLFKSDLKGKILADLKSDLQKHGFCTD